MAVSLDYRAVGITGATGWLGRRLVSALAQGVDGLAFEPGETKVSCLVTSDQPSGDLRARGVNVIGGDVRDPEACHAFAKGLEDGLLFHLAGVIHPRRRTRDFEEINVEGTRNVVDAALASGCRRIVVMSSNSPFGCNASPQERFTEESPYNPYMGYGRSKWRMELLLKDRMTKDDAPEIVIIRAPWFYGPGQPQRQTIFFRMIRDGRFPILGKGLNRRSMAYVDSLVGGLLLAAAKPEAAGQAYWLADEKPYTMVEIVETVATALREDFGITVAKPPPRLPAVIGDVATLADAALQAMGLYHQKVHVLSEMNKTIACDIGKARRELGYEPVSTLREGMCASIAWCLQYGGGL